MLEIINTKEDALIKSLAMGVKPFDLSTTTQQLLAIHHFYFNRKKHVKVKLISIVQLGMGLVKILNGTTTLKDTVH